MGYAAEHNSAAFFMKIGIEDDRRSEGRSEKIQEE